MKFRTDIQALRGIAVLLVILQHAQAHWLPGGYLGVDVFYVISGFLITGMVRDGLAQGHFRFGEFYFRRAKRLLPAAYVTFLLTAVAAVFLLDAREWRDFAAQLAGAVTFTANFVLLGQTGYFEGAAGLKPLLHTWSLAVEEQYYLLLPAALAFTPRRWWVPGTVAVFAASLALALVWARTWPEAGFYLLPARAWELAIGSLVAFAPQAALQRTRAVRWLFPPALALLVLVPLFPLPGHSPLNALAVCLATAVVILRAHAGFAAWRATGWLARVGDASYSLYLVHWPVFAFLHNVYVGDPALGEPSFAVRAGCVLLAIALGFLLHALVEQPVRRARLRPSRRLVGATLATSLVLAAAPLALGAHLRADARGAAAIDRADNVGFSPDCEFYRAFEPLPACRNAPAPRIMVWGDSFAMHLVPGIAASTDAGVLQATKSSCGPLLGIAQWSDGFPRAYAGNCLAFNRSVLDYLARAPTVETVVLSSPFYPYIDAENRRLLRETPHGPRDATPSPELAVAAMRDTVRALRRLGKRVVVVAPPPSDGADYTHCLERRLAGRTLYRRMGVTCDIPLASYHASKARTLALLKRIAREADVAVVSFDALLCDAQRCATMLQGRPIYRDEGHFSTEGARIVGRAMQLGRVVEARAR